MATPPQNDSQKHAIEHAMELWVFRSRWLMAPVYMGLIASLGALMIVFVREVITDFATILTMTPEDAILMVLSLIDMSLAGNLLLIVIFSGYENFVSKIDTGGDEDRPSWMGTVDFSGLKLRLLASIVAISAIALLRSFMKLSEGADIPDRTLGWLVGIHLSFVVSGALLAMMDLVGNRAEKS
jgi:uncharacterized protein (TIGR00645 family)